MPNMTLKKDANKITTLTEARLTDNPAKQQNEEGASCLGLPGAKNGGVQIVLLGEHKGHNSLRQSSLTNMSVQNQH